jgi:sigma-B regulation protein RsbU (phosphoserine phosphatase)
MEFNKNGFDHNVYMTVFYAIVNLRHLTITYSNAGHNVCPVVFNIKDNKRFEILMAPGIPISNWLEKPGYIDSVLPLTESDRLFFSTDGIIELKNVKENSFARTVCKIYFLWIL